MHNTRITLAAIAAIAITLTACGGSDADDAAAPGEVPPRTTAPADTATHPPVTTAMPTTSPATVPVTEQSSTTTATSTPATEPTTDWRDEVTAACAGSGPLLAAIVPNDGTAPSIAAEAEATRAVYRSDAYAAMTFPPDVRPAADSVAAMGREAVGYLDTSIERAAAGDTAAAERALEEGFDRLPRIATAWAIAGAQCGPADPARVQNADLTLPMEMGTDDIAAAFGSLWVGEFYADRVVRLDPRTGKVQATIDVGDEPSKMQQANGRLWVRSGDRFDAIDPATNTVTASLTKADVGPATTRNWALDGALWICDGRRVHRYDPTTLASIATIDIDVDCGAVYATPELVVAWSFNLDEGESGTSAAALVDPATNRVLATVPLPVDVGWPVVLPDSLFFAGYGGSQAVLVDPDTWTVTATPDLGVATGGHSGQPILEGQSIYIPAHDHMNVLVVDSTTFTVTDTIEPLGTGSIVIHEGALWVARGRPANIVQRFDLE